MRYNQLAHPNESSLGCVLCVPNAIFDEVTPVRNAGCPLCLLNFHTKGVQVYSGRTPVGETTRNPARLLRLVTKRRWIWGF